MIRLLHSPPGLGQVVALAMGMAEALDRWQARPGEILTVVDPEGRYFRARLLSGLREAVVFEPLPPGIEPARPRRLCPVIPDRERMLLILQKGVELGATEILPLISERSSAVGGVRHGQDKTAAWDRFVLKAARQCRRAIIPVLHPARSLEQFFADPVVEQRAFLDILESGIPLATWYRRCHDHPLAILSGPEGGWTDRERQLMLDRGAMAVSLGYRILRTETAAIAAMAGLVTLDSAFT
ncbi:MAG: 16S rRNA (uracil(1498)-N(3))-methyltransferase [Magnetococcales bacterium]|nr:16S rRNA (uracil(1498)-N(3))-methyltransferase [Magnetococcales bacterium]